MVGCFVLSTSGEQKQSEEASFSQERRVWLRCSNHTRWFYVMSGAQLRGLLIKPGEAGDRPWNAYVYCEWEWVHCKGDMTVWEGKLFTRYNLIWWQWSGWVSGYHQGAFKKGMRMCGWGYMKCPLCCVLYIGYLMGIWDACYYFGSQCIITSSSQTETMRG